MTKRIISTIIITALLASCFFTGASAIMMGDLNDDSSITAADARIALRTSVELETLNAEKTKAADVNYDGKITAADARILLRVSVDLEEIEIRDITFNGHKVESDCIGIEKGIVCTDSECCGETLMPSFNDLVNALKKPGSLNFFYGFTKTSQNTPKPTCKANGKNKLEEIANLGLAEVMEGLLKESVTPGEITEYTDLTKSRHLNNATFFVTGKEYVSALKENDVESVKMEKISGVDFVKNLPDSYKSTVSGETYDLKTIKAAQIGDVYKVTVTLKPEVISNKSIPQGTTPIEKILNDDYNDGIIASMGDLDGAFDEMPEMAGMFVMNMAITTKATVTYYFTVDTFEPVAATYVIGMETLSTMDTYFNNLFQKTDSATTTTTIKNDTVQENYFFFNKFFDAK